MSREQRHVECRIDDQIYVYLYEGSTRIETRHVSIPSGWWEKWPSDEVVRRRVHQYAGIGNARITSLEA